MEYDQKAIDRLKRLEGQIRGVLRMVEEGQECRDVVTQLSASRSAINRVMALIVSQNLEQCVRENIDTGSDTENAVKEAVDLLVKSM